MGGLTLARVPELANHLNLLLFVLLVVLQLALGHLWQQRRRTVLASDRVASDPLRTRPSWPQRFHDGLPALRWLLVLVYLAAAFHKLNHDFLTSSGSCARSIPRQVLHALALEGVVPEPPVLAAAIAGLAWEFAMPVLLLLRRGQRAGLLLAVALHALLSFGKFADFSMLALALASTFAPATWLAPLAADNAAPLRRVLMLVVAYGWLTLCGAAYPAVDSWCPAGLLQGSVWWACLALLAWPIVRAAHTPTWKPATMRLHAHSAAVPVAMALFALLPYSGLRTAGTFSMFSNLRVETERSNHLLLAGQPLRWSGHASDLLWIEALDPRLRRANPRVLQPGTGVPRVALRRQADVFRSQPTAPARPIWVAVRNHDPRRGGSPKDDPVQRIEDILNHPELPPLTWWEKRLLLFRGVDPEGASTCRW